MKGLKTRHQLERESKRARERETDNSGKQGSYITIKSRTAGPQYNHLAAIRRRAKCRRAELIRLEMRDRPVDASKGYSNVTTRTRSLFCVLVSSHFTRFVFSISAGEHLARQAM